jgi:hypothetical protein
MNTTDQSCEYVSFIKLGRESIAMLTLYFPETTVLLKAGANTIAFLLCQVLHACSRSHSQACKPQYLTGPSLSRRWCQLLWYIKNL